MPVVDQIDGVNAVIYYKDHPPPHVHFRAADFKAKFEIETQEMIAVTGTLPGKRARMLQAWIVAHRPRLTELWEEARAGRPISRV